MPARRVRQCRSSGYPLLNEWFLEELFLDIIMDVNPEQLFVCIIDFALRTTTDMRCRQINLTNKIEQCGNQANHGGNKQCGYHYRYVESNE